METVLITLHGEQLGSVVPAPGGVVPHADIERHVVIRANDYFGVRHIANMYYMGPLVNDGKQVLGYYIVESDDAGDEDLVFKLEDMSAKKELALEELISPEPGAANWPSLEAAVHFKFLQAVARGLVFICSKCSHVQDGGGMVKSEHYDADGGVFIFDAACNKCSRTNTLREVRPYSELFSFLQEAVRTTSPNQVKREVEGDEVV